MMSSAWLAALVVVILIGILVSWRAATAQRWYDRSEHIRKTASLVVGFLIAIVFLASGDPLRSFIGILLIALGSLYLFVERPWETI